MNQTIEKKCALKIKNTYDLKLAGKPDNTVETLPLNDLCIIQPYKLADVKPKLLVKIDDTVENGTALFFDKKNDKIKYLSPVSGVIEDIVYGPRRVIEKIIIRKSAEEKKKSLFSPLSQEDIEKSAREDLVEKITDGGCWNLITAYPFAKPPKQEDIPPAIYITIDNDEPYMVDSGVLLDEYKEDFLTGLAACRKLSDSVHIGMAANSVNIPTEILQQVTHTLEGAYPANNPGVFLYYNKQSKEENASWGVRAQDLIRIGELLRTGHYPSQRLIVVAGSHVKKPRHLKVTEGMPLTFMEKEINNDEPTRIIAGGVCTGNKVTLDDSIGYQDYALHVIRDGYEQELLSFFRPGFDKPTFSKTYMSAVVNKDEWEMTTSINGGYRSCISCGACTKVCPVESYPQFIMKALKANDIETAIEYGLLDFVTSGLCTYVCPSKIEIDDIIGSAKNKLYEELNKPVH